MDKFDPKSEEQSPSKITITNANVLSSGSVPEEDEGFRFRVKGPLARREERVHPKPFVSGAVKVAAVGGFCRSDFCFVTWSPAGRGS